jgi:4-amino-4-deoxy-L-arabinose transferase-like glycosyltransferase
MASRLNVSPRLILTLTLAAHAGLLLYGLRHNFVVLDEMGHIPAGLSHWETGNFALYRVNPPLGRMLAALPVLAAGAESDYTSLNPKPGTRSDWNVGRDFAQVNHSRYFDLVCLARLPGVAWSLLCGWLIARWASSLYGGYAGCLAAALWCFDPTVLAFAQVVTPDIPAAAAGLAATLAFRHYLRAGTWGTALSTGVLLGIAQLTKFTMLVLYGIWPLIWAAYAIGQWRGLSLMSAVSPARRAAHAATAIVVSLYIINLGYGFDRTFKPLGLYEFESSVLRGPGDTTDLGNRFRGGPLAALPVPVPEEYLQGIDAQRKDFERGYPSYLAGRWQDRGWWYYYLYALAVKEPLGTLALTAWGVALTIRRRPPAAPWPEEVFLWLPTLAVIGFVSSQTGFNHHMRYVLPAFPFAAVAAGKLAGYFRTGFSVKAGLVAGLLAWSVISTLSVNPHFMSYFNEVAGGPLHGHDHLLDSNIDWGQDLFYLKDWVDRHPEAQPIALAYFHFLDPSIVGLDYRLAPMAPTSLDNAKAEGPRPGYFAISVNYLRGITFLAPDGLGGWVWIPNHDSYAYFRRFQPIARAGYSIYIYKLTPSQADEARRGLGLPPLPRGGDDVTQAVW